MKTSSIPVPERRRSALAVLLALGAAYAAGPAQPAEARTPVTVAQASNTTLRAGETLRPGQSRHAGNHRVRLVMQQDGNLVLSGRGSRLLWSSQTSGNRGAVASMTRDGRLVVRAGKGRTLYTSGVPRNGANARRSRLVLQNDGNAVIYARGGAALWSARADALQLSAGQTLRPGQSRSSSNGRYVLGMSPDGNLVLAENGTGRPLWSSQTAGSRGATATLKADGSLVVSAVDGTTLYTSATKGDARSRLVVQDDGNAVVYAQGARPIWSSRTDVERLRVGQALRPGQSRASLDGRYLLRMGSDGNLALMDTQGGHQVLWVSGTAGRPGAWAAMEGDGNLVVHAPDGSPLYATGIAGDGGSFLVVQLDGNVVIYSAAGAPLWAWRG